MTDDNRSEKPKLVCRLTSDQARCWNLSSTQLDGLRLRLPGWRVVSVRSEEELLDELPGAEAAAVWFFRQEWFARAPRLRLLKTPAAGLDYFRVTPPDTVRFEKSSFHGRIMAETAVGWLLSHARGICRSAAAMKGPVWPRRLLADSMTSLRGSRLTILGFGSIGREIGRAASLLGCRITGIRRSPSAGGQLPGWFGPGDRLVSLEEEGQSRLFARVLPETDHLLLSLPGEGGTDGLIGAAELAMLPGGAGIYNLGRGNAIDQAALERHLAEDHESEAYLDVFETEPLPEESGLRRLPNAFLMPHISAATPEYLDLFMEELAAACGALRSGPEKA